MLLAVRLTVVLLGGAAVHTGLTGMAHAHFADHAQNVADRVVGRPCQDVVLASSKLPTDAF